MCRILSLDGGGSWSLIQVRALTALYSEQTLGHAVLADFDIVAANSGGSLVLAGLVENLTLGALLSYFEDEQKRKSIFSPTSSWGDWALQEITGLGPKYSEKAKLPALQKLLPASGTKPLSKVAAGIQRPGTGRDVHLLIMSFDYDRNRAAFFRSAPTGNGPAGNGWGLGESTDMTLAEAVHASANPPVNYFDGPAEFPDGPEQGNRYWDGAMAGFNNPVLAAVTEAIQLGVAPTDIAALSIGTGMVALPWSQPAPPNTPSQFLRQPTDQSLVNDLRKLATTIVDDPPDFATFLAHIVTGGTNGLAAPLSSRIVRMNPLISPVTTAGGWGAPGVMTTAQFAYLANLDFDAVDQSQVDVIADYATLWLQSKAPNQPIRMNGDTLALEIGDAWFANAVTHWQAVKPKF